MLYGLHTKRGPTLVFNGSTDQVVDIPHHGQEFFETLRQQTIALVGSSKDVFDFAFTPGGGHRPYFVTKPVALWLEEKLKFPDWTKKQIQAMPETHISEWVLKNHLRTEITPAYEHNEGGTLALGDDIPAVSRDSLHALPEAVWQSQQESYIYETWVDRAQAAVRTGAP
jgi:hypothetical protein